MKLKPKNYNVIPIAEPVNHLEGANVRWMGIDLSIADAPYGFLIVGAPGTGKSVTLSDLYPGLRYSAGVVYDYQKVLTEKIARYGVHPNRFRHLNPFHEYGFQWQLSLDIRTWETAFEFTAAFFPENKNSDPFWRDAPRLVMTVLIATLNRIAELKGIPPNWELRDLVIIATNKERLQKVCAIFPDLYGQVAPVFSSETSQMGDSVLFTISTALASFRSIAQLWHRAGQAGRNLSLYDILSEEMPIFMLGREEIDAKEALSKLNGIIVDFICKIFLSLQAENTTGQPRCWFILDELPSIAKIKYLIQVATEGRKQGLVLAIAFQSHPNLQKVCGVEDTSTLTGLLGYQAYFRSTEVLTQEWIVKSVGERQLNRPTVSNSRSRKNRWFSISQLTNSVSYSPVIEKAFLESEFSMLPLARDGYIEAVVKFRGSSIYRYKEPTMQVIARQDRLYPARPELRPYNYVRVNEAESELKDFTTDDLDRLGIPYDYFKDVAVDVVYSEVLSITAAYEPEEEPDQAEE